MTFFDVLPVVRRWLQQVAPLAVLEREVDVLAAAVHAAEGLLVEEQAQLVLARHLAHRLHDELVLVAGEVRLGELRRELELAARVFVVARREVYAEAREVALHVLHVGEDARRNRAEVVVLHLLVARRRRADERASAEADVGALLRARAVEEEELLLASDGRVDVADAAVAEELQHLHRARLYRLHRAQQVGLHVERRAVVGYEYRRDAERAALLRLDDERWARRVPGGVAARLECAARAARRERRGVRLALHEVLAAE